MRVVLDTNIFIDSARDEFSAQARLLRHLLDGDIEAIATPEIMHEYRFIMRKRIVSNEADRNHIDQALAALTEVTAVSVEVVIDDVQDKKFIEAAVGGKAGFIVTNDRHLLDVGEIEGVRMLRPEEMINRIIEEGECSGSAWAKIAKSLGI